MLSVGLLSLAYAPIGLFPLAWVGLVPWLLAVRDAWSKRSAFFWSWLGGVGFFLANMWWLANVTVPGMVALMVYLGLYWGLAAWIIRGCGLVAPAGAAAPPSQGEDRGEGRGDGAVGGDDRISQSQRLHPHPGPFPGREREQAASFSPVASIFLLAAVWTALEWVRGNLFTGLPWLFLGHTQTPFLPLVQIADLFGAYGVSFPIVMINGWAYWLYASGWNVRRLIPATAAVGAVLIGAVGYGLFRLSQDALLPGPTVMVVQPNYPQDNTGQKGATLDEIIDFHLQTTRKALEAEKQAGRGVDLVVWSETIMPALNAEALEVYPEVTGRDYWARAHAGIGTLAADFGTSFLVGSKYEAGIRPVPIGDGIYPLPEDERNSVYLYDRTGTQSQLRYDKIHIVPFGETLPFKHTVPWLFDFLLALTPYDHDYSLTPGDEEELTVFPVAREGEGVAWRFVVPICFEDIDSILVAKMFRPQEADAGAKRADFIVNVTNDGWFMANEMAQHLQVASFRSIENRVPTARSVNTGISGFIDSSGRAYDLVPAGTEGTSVAQIMLDRRLSLYTLVGDVFAIACVVVTAGVVGACLIRRLRREPKV